MKFKPLGDRILLKQLEAKEQTKGGILIPDTVKEKPQEGEIIAVGEGKKNPEGKVVALSLKAGDKVLYGKYSGTEVVIDGDDYLIIREDDVLGIIA
ncbi:MAG: co-chaperone GroES [Candidatus Omnitrophica bacterium]|nr:co-chaperone GroES [Candidatus Omnitrophota bacterium]